MKISKAKISIVLICIFIFIFGNSIFDTIIKNSNLYGMRFNSERKKNGLQIINENWIVNSESDVNFKVSWINKLRNEKHYSKTIEYNYFGAKTEIDEYKTTPESFDSYYSKYHFNEKKFEYYSSMCSGAVEVNKIISEKEFKSKTEK